MSEKIEEVVNQYVDWDAIGGINGEKLAKKRFEEAESVTNLNLMKNGLRHLIFECTLSSPSDFRVAREAHLILYRAMIEALRGSANQNVVEDKNKRKQHFYRFDDPQWYEIHKEEVSACKKAWRFSAPVQCATPTLTAHIKKQKNICKKLIHFYEALAKIQAECFMKKYCDSKTVPVTDDEVVLLHWLHWNVRNEYEHFIAKLYGTYRDDLIETTSLCLRLAQELLFESGNAIIPSEHEMTELM